MKQANAKAKAKRNITDKQRLDWLFTNEAHLVSSRELWSEGWVIWWYVVKRRKSLSGHPLPTPRQAIDAAMRSTK